ncbi:tannase/feruloyl esterase family alpha/beta hydrolase [Bradyrhizobium yuanmingense]|nr:tannase/feruloyl esterase family alpha/beta hydrolase [Bradyrhizobium yuanmingense]
MRSLARSERATSIFTSEWLFGWSSRMAGEHLALIGRRQPTRVVIFGRASQATGGHEGVMPAQRYSHDFEGIVAMAPTLADRRQYQVLWNQGQLRLPGGRPSPSSWVLEGKQRRIVPRADDILASHPVFRQGTPGGCHQSNPARLRSRARRLQARSRPAEKCAKKLSDCRT